jgi:bidirectional [NiFe] hydrogenase diaphorase subunit
MENSSDKRYQIVEKSIKKLGFKRESLIEILHIAQDTFGYLDKSLLRFISKRLKLPPSKVYAVATFYHHFHLKPKAAHSIVVCTGTACYIKGANLILDRIKDRYGVDINRSSEALSLFSARCVGSCSLAPVLIVDNQIVGKVKEDESISKIEEIIK